MGVAFLTLFLGLTSGTAPVTLSGGPAVASIEILLDGRSVAQLDAPPWSAEIDFGADLVPHRLQARGFDVDEREVARAEQWINLPRPPAEVEIAFEPAAGGRARLARLAWQSRTNDRPTSISLTLDGKPLTLDGENRAAIPAHAGAPTSRVLSAELRFAHGVTARKDVVLESQFGDQVATELTSIPLRLKEGAKLPPASELQGWFAADGKPVRAIAVEAGPPHLRVVRAPGATESLIDLFWRRLSTRRFLLPRGSRVRFLATTAQLFSGPGTSFELFDESQDFDAAKQGLLSLLAAVVEPTLAGRPSRVADAVAVAGLQAIAGSGPRAVLLVLPAGGGLDGSRFSGSTVRRYLAALHVPFFVWSAGAPSDATLAAWGLVEDVSTARRMERAFQSLEEELDAQRIILLDGRYLPQSISLASQRAAELASLP